MTSRAKTLLQHPPKIRESTKGSSGAIMLAADASTFGDAAMVIISERRAKIPAATADLKNCGR